MSTAGNTLDIPTVRSSFPALQSGYIFADNAGGSQCLSTVVSRISDYLLNTNVQLGANYSVSVTSTKRVSDGVEAARELFNADTVDEIAFGSSSTMLVENLSRAISDDILDGEEIIITGEHEANGGPWKRLAQRRGLTIKYWNATQIPESPTNPYAVSLQLSSVLSLITSKTRLIAFTGCSNILGSIVPVKPFIAAMRAQAQAVGVRKIEFCVDCVAYAPHRRIDVRDWDVDYCFFSLYKVYGPHIATLYARASSITGSLSSIAHHFLPVTSTAYKMQPGGPGYELRYSCTAISEYIRSLSPSGTLTESFDLIAKHEQELLEPLIKYLKSKEGRGVRIIGDESVELSRAPTVSFVVAGEKPIRSKDVVDVFDRHGKVGIRYGHFYAYSVVESLQPSLSMDDCVVRISLVHYNTVDEVQKIIRILDGVLV